MLYTEHMDCHGIVIGTSENHAMVRVARVNCAECGGCGLLARNREHNMEFEAVDRLGVEEGDEVILEVPSRRLSFTYLVVFGLPVLAMAAAFFAAAAIFAFAGKAGGEAAGIIAAIVAGFGAFWVGVKLADRMGLRPVIREIVKVREENVRAEDVDDAFTGGVL